MTSNPRELVFLQWRDIRVRTEAGRPLLHGISGIAHPGELVALMGASGAGKTTLLNTLLHRNLGGLKVDGEILVNGQRVGRGITSVSAYVQQEDLFVGTLTVREHLMVQAKLRLPASFSDAMRKDRVEDVIKQMMLESSQASLIGVPGIVKGISGGEMKRLAFATALLNNPPIFFCDEPTTGLDSHMASIVIKRLESLASNYSKTIICTIHQPSSEIFELFDKVVFLSQGRIAFHGTPYESVKFFANCGYLVPDHTNPADFYIDVLAIWPERAQECRTKANAICDEFAKSVYNTCIVKEMEQTAQPRLLRPHQGGSMVQIILGLTCRHTKDNFRNASVLRAKFVEKVFMGIFLGALYFQTTINQDGVSNINGVLFFFCSEFTYPTIYGIQTYMPGEFPLVLREYHDGIYPVSAYYLAKILSYLPIFSLDGILLTCITYGLIGLAPTFRRFMKTIITGVLVELNVASLGVAISSLSPSYAVAVTITGPLLTMFSMTGGLFTNVEMMPEWISWVQYLSWFRFGYESLIINEWTYPGHRNISCSLTNGAVAKFCQRSGDEVIKNLHFDPSNMYFNWVIMVLYTVMIYCIGYIGLVYRVLKHR